MDMIALRPLFSHFAEMLAYPDSDVPRTAAACANYIAAHDPEAAALIGTFAGYAAETHLDHLEEAYTSVFDLDPKCALYVGYHLLGESYKRSAFLLGLNEHFGANRFTPPGEVPDHLSIVLHSLAASKDEELDRELISEAIMPALDRMTGRIRSKDDADPPEEAKGFVATERPMTPYMTVLEALRSLLIASGFEAVAVETRNNEPVAAGGWSCGR